MHAEFINVLVNPGFSKFRIFFMKFPNLCYATLSSVQISAKKLNPRGNYSHFSKFKMAAGSHLVFSKFRISDEIFQYLLCQGICSLNFSQKSSIHAEVINILVNPRWRPAAILDFQNFAFLMKFSNFCYAKVYAVQISAKKLNPCGSY